MDRDSILKNIKLHERTYKTVAIIGSFGLIDIASRTLLNLRGDIGVVSYLVYWLATLVIPLESATYVGGIVSTIAGFSVLFLIWAWREKIKIKKLRHQL